MRPLQQIAIPTVVALLAELAMPNAALAAASIGVLDVNIAASESDAEGLKQGVALFRLGCSPNLSFCEFRRITLNQCTEDGESKRSFVPQVDSWTTSSGRLKVRRNGAREIELTVYQAFGQKLPGKVVLTFVEGEPDQFKRLSGFRTSGFVDFRSWPALVKYMEYVPVSTDGTKELDCPVALRGLQH